MKLLLVRLSSMGDLIHTLPAISDVVKHRPDVELSWLCESGFADIARLHPFVQHVYTMSWRRWRKALWQGGTWREMAALKQTMQAASFDAVLDSQGLLKSAFFAKWANAPIWGLDTQSARESLAVHFYTQTYAVKKGEDAVWRNRQLFAQALGYVADGAPDFGVRVPDIEQSSLHLPDAYHVALHATSRDSKLWAIENWQALWRKQNEQDGLPVLLPWGNDAEKHRAEQIAQTLPFAQVCPRMTLLQAAFCLNRATSVVGVDTGLLHLANAVNRPLVGIYTDSDPIKTGVQTSSWAMNVGGIGQMPSVEEVWQALNKVQAAFYSKMKSQ
ncbi:lipopolysaccharide heptosyltransferase I [Kingella kingae]|uniref:lipopolysaccharide heptosyltransferase I n=1 Tax=Kingella kingae TaxID=504 RepID=UPI00254B1BE1|nr:lipopolysaccharide heptosyltransferase I [Kingella kingae]MDK4650308.1 lipopolysaccharide heptosyltransferase I [Kingella kingae]